MNYDSYLNKVLSRLLTPGVALLIVGAVVGYASGRIAALFIKAEGKQRGTLSLALKAVGVVLAILGAVLVFTR